MKIKFWQKTKLGEGERPKRVAKQGELVFVRAKSQAAGVGVEWPERIFSGFVAEVFPGSDYVNVVCSNCQPGPAWFKACSVYPVGEICRKRDNVFAYTREELEV